MKRLEVGEYLIVQERTGNKFIYLIAGSFKLSNGLLVYTLVNTSNIMFGFFAIGLYSGYFAVYSVKNKTPSTVIFRKYDVVDFVDIGLSSEIINAKKESWISATVKEIKRRSREVAKKFYDDKCKGVGFSKLPEYRRKILNELDSYLYPDKYIIEFI